MIISININVYEVLRWYLIGCAAMVLLSAFSMWNYHRRHKIPFRLKIRTFFDFVAYVALSWFLFIPAFFYFVYQTSSFFYKKEKKER